MYKEWRKIVTFNSGYMSLKPNGGNYHKHGRHLKDLRSLLNYVQNTRLVHKFDFSELDSVLRKKLEDIVSGIKTVTDKDWRAKV
ncbi:MAG: hypothetical protein QXR60_01970 [Candidatus Nanoarchaeia archaeon]